MKKKIQVIGINLFLSVIIIFIIPYLLGFKFAYFTDIDYDYDAIAAGAQVIGVIFTSILTVMIILQTNITAKNQLEFEKISSYNQLEFQKFSALSQEAILRHQIKMDLFERRVVIFEWIFKLFTNISIIIQFKNGEENLEKNLKQIIRIFKFMKSEDKLDIYSLHRAEYLFPKELAVKMRKIFELYTEIGVLVNISSPEMGLDLTKSNREFYVVILTKCQEILKYQDCVLNACDTLLNISEIDYMDLEE